VAALQINNNADSTDFPTSGNVQWSDDGISWTTVASWTMRNVTGVLLTVNWTKATHRYWRLLAEATANGGAGNWWSIYEINCYGSAYPGPVTQSAHQTFDLTPQTVLWARGFLRKTETGDAAFVAFALDSNNWYGATWENDSSSLLLVKVVAGTQTTLATLTFDTDTEGHVVELAMVLPNGAAADNWLSLRANRTGNAPASADAHDAALDFTNNGTGKAAGGQFLAFGLNDAPYRGWAYLQMPASYAAGKNCTIAYGGDSITITGGYKIHTFLNSGTFTVEQVGNGSLGGFLVGGGGGGASGSSSPEGGTGGAIVSVSWPLKVGTYAVTVGAGGAADADGSASSVAGLSPTALGGAKGLTAGTNVSPAGSGIPNAPGGFSGGSGVAFNDGIGDSGYAGGGGGGAGAAGANGQQLGSSPTFNEVAGAGGNGYLTYGGGGGGGCGATGAAGTTPWGGSVYGGGASGGPGSPNTGGGGGGGVSGGAGGAGGTGIVVLSYLYDQTLCG
ncbi:MAG: hypothetical protein KGI71_05350, partial [Patescibacteria group bacterium]|nr:hypothetical protein [Patescibacteria group bacterium]